MEMRIWLKISLPFALFLVAFFSGKMAFASEINYAALLGVYGNDAQISYRGPSGGKGFLCNIQSKQCLDFSTSISALYTSALPGFTVAARSSLGSFTLVSLSIYTPSATNVYYSLYDTRGKQMNFKALLPFYKPAPRIYFSKNESAIILTTASKEIYRYDINTGILQKLKTSQSDYPFISISEDGTRVAAYNYLKKAIVVWNFTSETKSEVKTLSPTYVEFLKDGRAIFGDSSLSFNTLYSVKQGGAPIKLVGGTYEINDFITSGDSVYYIANAVDPLTWSLYKLDTKTGINEEIVRDVSYGTSLKVIPDYIVVSKITGKNSNLVFINRDTGLQTNFAPMGDSPAASNIKRESIVVSKRRAALLTPENGSPQNLIVWLHGGPNRQTSLNYHSYLSYAVYDELLERLAEAGNYVLKLDYIGSTGYGKEIQDALNGNVGRGDVADVLGAIKEFKNSHPFTNVYIIGNSYGGYLGLRTLVEDPTLIKGVASISGVTDWYGLIWKIPSSPFVKYFGNINKPVNISNYLAASIYAKVAPLSNQKMLLFYGEDDTEVPIWQSKNFYDYAKAFGKNAELISYPDEGHIPQKRATLNDICSRVAQGFAIEGVKCSE